MKQIMSQYGGVILAGVVMILLFLILMNVEVDGKKGIFEITGSMATAQGADYSQNQDQEKVAESVQRRLPILTFECSEGRLMRGRSYSILEYLYVTLPDDGSIYSLSQAEQEDFSAFSYGITRIESPEGTDMTYLYDIAGKTMIFPMTGTYTFQIDVKDSEQKETRLYIKVPVDL